MLSTTARQASARDGATARTARMSPLAAAASARAAAARMAAAPNMAALPLRVWATRSHTVKSLSRKAVSSVANCWGTEIWNSRPTLAMSSLRARCGAAAPGAADASAGGVGFRLAAVRPRLARA